MPLPQSVAKLPIWKGNLTSVPVSGGLSNEIWRVTDANGDHIVRLGLDYPWHHVDRAREAMTTAAAYEAGFGPALQHFEPGVMITDFLRVKTWTEADVRADPGRVVDFLAKFHRKMPEHVSGAAFLFCPFHVCRDYTRTLAATRHASVVPMARDLASHYERAQVPLRLVFGHNDLLPANLLEDDHRLWLVDYEYAGFASPLFDLAGLASNAGMSPEEGHDLLARYPFEAILPSRTLQRSFDAMRVAALLREWLWALVSDIHLSAPGVDYMAYAAENYARLERAKDDYHRLWGE